jgi:hypothetical protein
MTETLCQQRQERLLVCASTIFRTGHWLICLHLIGAVMQSDWYVGSFERHMKVLTFIVVGDR